MEVGDKLNLQRSYRKGFALKGLRQHIIKTNDPSTIGPDELLTVRFPDLKENQVIIPGTTKLTFNITLAGTDANRTLVGNLGRNIIRKLVVQLEGNEIISIDDYDILYSYYDCWKCMTERHNAVFQGIVETDGQTENAIKHQINTGDKASNVKDQMVASIYDNRKLFSISFPQLHCLQELALESTNFDYSSAEYRVIAIILDIANFRLFRPVRSDVPAENPKHFMKIKFFNKAVDAINLPALLRSTSVTNKIPVYFRDKEPPVVSYEYTSTVASKVFNFSPALSNLNVSEYFSNPQTCQCKESKFCYEPHGHVITGDLRVVENAKLRELVAKGPKYREPNRVNWKATETMFLESIDLYAKN